MISSCSKCRANYDIDESRIQGGRVLLHCQVCGHWFSVAVGSEPEQIIAELELKTEEPIATSHAITQELPGESSESVEYEITFTEDLTDDSKPAYLKLLVADAPTQFRTRVVKTLNEIDPTLELVVVDDGGLAMGALAGFAPDLAIIGTAIEKVYCFEICDYMRATDRLKDTRIVFAAELHQAAWNCAEPESLFGADAWMSNAATDDELFAGLRDHIETVRTNHQQTPS